MTTAVVRRWGNSLALRIPRDIAAMLDIAEAMEVEMSTQDGRLVIDPRRAPEYALDEMLQGCKPAHFRTSADERAWLADRPAGRELL